MKKGIRTFPFYVDSNRLSEMYAGNEVFSMMLHVPKLNKDGKLVVNSYVQKNKVKLNKKDQPYQCLTLVNVSFSPILDEG